MTISQADLYIVAALGIFIIIFILALYRPLQYLAYDEVSAKVAGLPADTLNLWLSVLTALTAVSYTHLVQRDYFRIFLVKARIQIVDVNPGHDAAGNILPAAE